MSDIRIGKLVLSVCETNCYYVYREGGNECIVIDPADKGKYIYETLKNKGYEVKAILITHGHFDHIWGCGELRELTEASVYALDMEKDVLENSELNSSAMVGRPCTVKADVYMHDMDVVDIMGFKIQVLATPGHTQGSCCYYFVSENTLFSGDTLFLESVGRTDLPTGSMSALSRSISSKLSSLPDETEVLPGHGDRTTIAHERDYNPFWK